jgi:hypothetical protein
MMALANAVLYTAHPRSVLRYRHRFGRLPNIANPRRYTERMLWRKIVDHDPQFVVFSDKLAAKDYCKRICPDLPIPNTLWIGDDADAIPDELLRGDVFVKANHGYDFNAASAGDTSIEQRSRRPPIDGSAPFTDRAPGSGPTPRSSRSYSSKTRSAMPKAT